MTGKEFVDTLVVSGLFYERIPSYLVDLPITYNRIPSHIKFSSPGSFSFDIKLSYCQGGIRADFFWSANCLFASYKLSELTIIDLINEMDKFLLDREIYTKWRQREMRDYLLESFISPLSLSS